MNQSQTQQAALSNTTTETGLVMEDQAESSSHTTNITQICLYLWQPPLPRILPRGRQKTVARCGQNSSEAKQKKTIQVHVNIILHQWSKNPVNFQNSVHRCGLPTCSVISPTPCRESVIALEDQGIASSVRQHCTKADRQKNTEGCQFNWLMDGALEPLICPADLGSNQNVCGQGWKRPLPETWEGNYQLVLTILRRTVGLQTRWAAVS